MAKLKERISGSVDFLKRSLISLNSPSVTFNQFFSHLFTASTDDTVTADNIQGISAAFRAIRILSESIADVPLNVYKSVGANDIEIQDSHRVHKLISKNPSPWYTSTVWRDVMMVHALITGNGLSHISRSRDGMPVEIRMIDPALFNGVTLVEGKKVMYQISGREQMIPSEDVIHLMGPSNNGFVGMNMVEAHRASLSTARGATEYARNIYKNGAHIRGVLEVPAKMSEQAYTNLKNSWMSEFSGPENVGKTPILEEGVRFNPIKMTPSDLQYLETKKDLEKEVSQIFGVPLYMLSNTEDANYNNIEALSLMFLKHGLRPWLVRWQTELDRKLFTQREKDLGYFTQFDTSGLIQADMETMGDYFTKLWQMGVLNQNEIRKSLGRNSIEGGDRRFIQGNNMTPLDRIDDIIDTRSGIQMLTEA